MRTDAAAASRLSLAFVTLLWCGGPATTLQRAGSREVFIAANDLVLHFHLP